MNNHILEAARTYIREVKQSPEYQEYETQLEKIQKEPELFDKVNEFRKRNFELQNSEYSDNLMDRVEELEREFASVREIPLVEDFLEAELAFCRMMQEAETLIATELDFQ